MCTQLYAQLYNKNEVVEDYAICFPQTGFDVHLGSNKKNFVCFFGGNKEAYNFELILEQEGSICTREIAITNSACFQMHLLYIEDIFPEAKDGMLTKVTIDHDLDLFLGFMWEQKKLAMYLHSHILSLTQLSNAMIS